MLFNINRDFHIFQNKYDEPFDIAKYGFKSVQQVIDTHTCFQWKNVTQVIIENSKAVRKEVKVFRLKPEMLDKVKTEMKQEPEKTEYRILMKNIRETVNMDDLKLLFGTYGQVLWIHHKGTEATIRMVDEESMNRAHSGIHGYSLDGAAVDLQTLIYHTK